MKTILKLFVLCMVALSVTAFVKTANLMAGVKLISGDVKIIKGEKQICLKYDYTDMKVGSKTEEAYLNEKVKEKNKKEPGSGDSFKEKWFGDRASRFQPKFDELLNKYISKNGITADEQFTSAKYTLILKTTFTDPGYNVGVSRKPAYINVEILIVETSDQSKVGAKLTITKAPGTSLGNDYDSGERLSEAYAKCGKTLGIYLNENAFGK